MPTKEDLLYALTVKQLKQLAKENRIKLVREDWFGETYHLSTKDEIIEILSESFRIIKKKILKIVEPSPKPTRRRRIPKAVKEAVWGKYIGMSKAEGKCYVCGRTIHITRFEVGHNKAVAKGGTDNITNLRPICRSCNLAMGTMSIKTYKRKYFSKRKKRR